MFIVDVVVVPCRRRRRRVVVVVAAVADLLVRRIANSRRRRFSAFYRTLALGTCELRGAPKKTFDCLYL